MTVAVNPPTHSPGTYALIIALDRARTLQVGRRGKFHFPAGFYFYAGSALGPGGLAGRLERHVRAAKRLDWHVDYFWLEIKSKHGNELGRSACGCAFER